MFGKRGIDEQRTNENNYKGCSESNFHWGFIYICIYKHKNTRVKKYLTFIGQVALHPHLGHLEPDVKFEYHIKVF